MKEQYSNDEGYTITQYAMFKFEKSEAEPHIKATVLDENDFTIAMEPLAAQVAMAHY